MTSDGVMMAKVIWKAAISDSGMVPDMLSTPMSPRNMLSRLPNQAPSPEKASE